MNSSVFSKEGVGLSAPMGKPFVVPGCVVGLNIVSMQPSCRLWSDFNISNGTYLILFSTGANAFRGSLGLPPSQFCTKCDDIWY